MRLIAHRGFAGVNPENTLQAVEAAAGVADAIEVDVRRCASDDLVVIHDGTVDRIADGEGRVADHGLAELRELDVLGTGEGIPTLEAVLKTVPETVGVNVELKERGTASDAIELMASLHPQTVVSSFSSDVLAACQDADPSVSRAFLTAGADSDAIQTALELECGYIHPAVDDCDERLVSEAHHAGMSVNAWTVERREEAEALARLGVDGVIADRPDVRPKLPE